MMSMFSAPGSRGTAEQVVEDLTKLRDLGCDYVICYFPEAAYDRSVELFEREVIPRSPKARTQMRIRFPSDANAVVRSGYRVGRRRTHAKGSGAGNLHLAGRESPAHRQ
jgi:hypothetical protein